MIARVDLDSSGTNVGAMPRFQHAVTQSRLLWRLAVVFLIAAVVMGVATLHPAAAVSVWKPLLRNNAAAMLLLSLGLQSSWWVARWRKASAHPVGLAVPAWLHRFHQRVAAGVAAARLHWRLVQWLVRAFSLLSRGLRSDASCALWLSVMSAAVVWLVCSSWDLTLATVAFERTGYIVGGVALLVAFVLLVQERYFAAQTPMQWPEAPLLAYLTRSAIAVLLLSALALFFTAAPRVWVVRLAVIIGVLPAIVAAEIVMRAMLSLFVRNSERIEPRVLADSVVASLWRWPPRPLYALQDELRARFGIDLRQSWAFAFMRRALLPVLGVIALIGWLATGIREIPIDGRGIYERFGRPVVVLSPGVHLGLPWLLARVRPVENGVVRTLAITVGADEPEEPDESRADDPAPASANRLWDESHLSENSQVIASASGDRQSFQIVNMDVGFVYRIGLTDAAAMAATYNSTDVDTLLHSTASRVLVHDFASRTLDALLGERRLELAAAIRQAVQADLDRAHSGIEILATLIEAVHPPAGAANAYHSVQAAQIKVQETIARERGRAAQQINEAQLNAAMMNDKSVAAAREARASAEVVGLRFSAERDGYRTAGKAFLHEQYLTQLAAGLSSATVVIVDHRIRAGQAPTIDLRPFSASSAAARGE